MAAVQLSIPCLTAASTPIPFRPEAGLAALFTPARPVLGRYEVFVAPRPITDLARGPIEALEGVDAFGLAGPYDRAALVRLYRGIRPQVSRSWTVEDGDFELLTFISPYPDPAFRQLLDGTLIIRWTCDRRCRSAEALALH